MIRGVIFVVLIGLLASLAHASWGDQEGREVHVLARLSDAQGKAVEGLIPATITIARPDGTRSDYSRHAVFRRGQLDCRRF